MGSARQRDGRLRVFPISLMNPAQIFLVRIVVLHLPKDPNSKGFVARAFVEFARPVDPADPEVNETVFEAAKAAVAKGYILKGQKAEFQQKSIEPVPKIYGKPVQKPLARPGGILAHLMGEERK